MEFMGTAIDWPLDHNVIRRNSVNNTFGMVRKNLDGTPRPHQGWDFYAKAGTHCYAIASGKVAHVESRGSLGLMVVIGIGRTGKYAAYCHLSSAKVRVGDMVVIGQQIGVTGNSGNAEGMKGIDEHLHFEIRDKPLTGTGLDDRMSPLKVFGVCPLTDPIVRSPA